MVWNYNQVYMLRKDRTNCMSNHVRKYNLDQTSRNYHCCLSLKNFRRYFRRRKKTSKWSNKFLSRHSHWSRNKSHRNTRFRWNRVYSRIHKDNSKFLCRSRFGLIRRSLLGWKSTYRTDSSYYKCNNRYIHSHPYRLSHKTNKLRMYNSDIRLGCSRFRKRNHKHNARSSF